MCAFLKKKPLLDPRSQEEVVARIRAAESRTTGEIRVFLESRCTYMDAMHRAEELFTELAMHQTEQRNAVLLYMAVTDHQFAIYGDTEIYAQAGGQQFWDHAAAALKDHLKEGRLKEGLCACVDELGNALALHFPADPDVAKNELPDEIIFGK